MGFHIILWSPFNPDAYLSALMGSLAAFARLCRTVISCASRQKSAFSDTTTDECSPVCCEIAIDVEC